MRREKKEAAHFYNVKHHGVKRAITSTAEKEKRRRREDLLQIAVESTGTSWRERTRINQQKKNK